MDVIEIDATNEYFRLVFDTKGRFVVHRISKEESSYKLLKVKQQATGKGGVPHIVTHDGRTIRYPDPDIKVLLLLRILLLLCCVCCHDAVCCKQQPAHAASLFTHHCHMSIIPPHHHHPPSPLSGQRHSHV